MNIWIKFSSLADAFKFNNVIGGGPVQQGAGYFEVKLGCSLNDAELAVEKFRPLAVATFELVCEED